MAQVSNNKSFNSIFSITLMAAALGITACSSPATTDADIKTRQNTMKGWSDATGIMGDMIKAPNTFDAAEFKAQAAFLAEDSASPWSHFENKEAMGNATEAVWSNVDGFRAEADDFQKATAELNTVAQTATSVDQVLPALGQVGDSCKSCHTDFKVKKD